MSEHELKFSPNATAETATFKLLELPPDLCKLVEASLEAGNPLSLCLKGQSGDDAVLCTNDKTYSMRSIVLSNTLCVVTSNPDDEDGLAIRDQLNEILELTPAVPKLHKLSALLKGAEYKGEDEEDEDMEQEESQDEGPRLTYDDALNTIQASKAELDRGLRERRILNIDGELRPISLAYLNHVLVLILNILVSHSLEKGNLSVEKLCSALSDDHEIPRRISTQVMSWFGELSDGTWKMDAPGLVKELGLGILRNHRDDPIGLEAFTSSWKETVGDSFEELVKVDLLSGNYLEVTEGIQEKRCLKYFPASELPVDPAARFGDLFLTRPRWKGDGIAPFLADIALNSKEQDKLLLKYARAITEKSGIWYTARAQYNG